MRRTLVVMLKEPRPGRVKTRLGRQIGMVEAAWWFRHQTRRLLQRLQDRRWETVLAVSPDVEGMRSRIWPAHVRRSPQGGGNLGDRMRRALAAHRPGPVCVIGADVPEITRHHIAEAFRALGRAQAVIGPAPDGGYWLIGLRNLRPVPPRLFDGVRWSTHHALADTLASLGDIAPVFVASLRDVDTADDLRMTAPDTRATSVP